MPIPTLITDLSTTASSNSPAGSDSPATLDDIQRAHASFIAQLRDGKADEADLTAATGASLVGYQPTGGIATTVQSALRQLQQDGFNLINVDLPPYSGNLIAAYQAIPATGGTVLVLGNHEYNILGIGANTKPNVKFIGIGVPVYDPIAKRLTPGTGTILQGQLYNQSKGFGVFSLGIDYGEWVRVNLAGGQYNDAFANIGCGENANIAYGDLIVLSTDVIGGNPASNTHCILNQTGTGFKQTGIIEVIGGYHGHVIKVYDFVGDTTVARYQVGTGLIIKADAGSSAGKVSISRVVINGDTSRASSGVLLEAQTQSVSSIRIGELVAFHSQYVIAEAAATTHPIVDVSIGSILAGAITGGGGATQAVSIGGHSVGFVIESHALNSCTNGGLSVAYGAVNVDIGSGYSKLASGGSGYKFDAPARHGRIYAGENAGWGVLNGSNYELNAIDVMCTSNSLGGISVGITSAFTLLGSWSASSNFRVIKYGSAVRISGLLTGGGIGTANTWFAVAQLTGNYPAIEEVLACAGYNSNGDSKPLMARVTPTGEVQVYGMGGQAILGIYLSGMFVLQGNT